ncbi:MAG: hypothetical protein C4522_22100 [Desulfobacteraceae bacterium]|nr:MAG: hypothetical protein C4522_22100 [Desulfobacteraceae bacterium]
MGKNYKLPAGTWIEREMFESRAFMALTGCALQLLIIFLSKRQFEKISTGKKEKRFLKNADSLIFTYIEAKEKYGIGKKRFTRGIDQLLEKGFISIVHQGGAFKQDKTQYGLSDKWTWWKPGIVSGSRTKETVSRGFRKPKKEKVTVINAPIHTVINAPIEQHLGGHNRTQGKLRFSLVG